LTERHPQIPLPGPAAGPLVPARWIGPLAVAGFFGLRLLLAVVIIKLSALHLPLTEFATFSQFLMFLGFLNLISTAGLQNGVVRQIAADRSPLNVRSVMRAATGLWAAVVVVIGLAVIICRSQVSQLLVGDARGACAIPALVVLAAFAGGGQVICALLTGSGRVTSSLTAQAVGLVAATAAGSWGLLHQHALLAVLGYGAGALATPLTALWLARDLHPLGRGATRDLLQEGRQLLGLSGSFAVVASLMPLALFVMRRLFQLRFGLAALSFWLVANRISDVNTQLLGLYMAQVYLPAAANAQDDAALRVRRGPFGAGDAVPVQGLCARDRGHSDLHERRPDARGDLHRLEHRLGQAQGAGLHRHRGGLGELGRRLHDGADVDRRRPGAEPGLPGRLCGDDGGLRNLVPSLARVRRPGSPRRPIGPRTRESVRRRA
jgi:hypothetical protein